MVVKLLIDADVKAIIDLINCNALEQAEKKLNQLITINPENTTAIYYLGLVFSKKMNYDQALSILTSILPNHTDNADLHFNIGINAIKMNYFELALEHFETCISQRTNWIEPYVQCANVLAQLGDIVSAIRRLKEAIVIEPENTDLYVRQGIYYSETGDYVLAEENFRNALRLNPSNIEAFYELAHFKDFNENDKPLIDHMTELSENSDLSPWKFQCLNFSLAKIHEKEKDYNMAFEHYIKVNISKKEHNTNTTEFSALEMSRISTVFNQKVITSFKNSGLKEARPIFIIGMPRTGSTLCEQFLHNHPMIHAAGELSLLRIIINSLQANLDCKEAFPENSIHLTPETIQSLARAYWGRVSEKNQNLHIIDKMPYNFLYLGIIATMFPNARIIHTIRDPMDTCLSIFCQNFSNPTPYTNSLEGIAEYYNAYEKLMTHWKNVLPIEIHNIHYEQLVMDTKKTIEDCLAFCQLPWDPNCLKHNKSHRYVGTASTWQVRESLYSHSIGKWQSYGDKLEILKKTLN
ncbi:MAG: sulfotransferase [Gammaproteobacteria bacterium]|nr:sulfotransferase [Gammaproteobacteria bacterium]